MYIFGGNDLTDTFGDFWKIDLKPLVQSYRAASPPSSSMPLHPLESTTEWIHIQGWSPDYPSERIGHTMTPIGSNYFVLYGGRNYLGGTMADGLSLSVSLDLSLSHALSLFLLTSLPQVSFSMTWRRAIGMTSPPLTMIQRSSTGQDTVASPPLMASCSLED
jgi:hypothetical protein